MSKTFAVLSYPDSNNLGDFIQSIAAKQELSENVHIELNRDQLHNYDGSMASILLNGWFMEKPDNWPPSKKIKPFFLSFHLNPTAKKGMLTLEGIAYFKKHQPIGCRDRYTQKLLLSYEIDAYYSGCLTLSLNRNNFVSKNTKRKGIYVISPFERFHQDNGSNTKTILNQIIYQIKRPFKHIKYIQARKRLDHFLDAQKEPIYYTSQLRNPLIYSEQERIAEAKQQLKEIANAKLIITSRIHSALPAVAFETPVLFLSDGLEHINQKSRLEGMDCFFPILNSSDLNKWISKRPKPSKAHLPFVEKMRRAITSFVAD